MPHIRTVTDSPTPPTWRRIVASPAVPVALLALFAAVIILTINRFSIWIDESGSLLITGSDSYANIARRVTVDAHPPLWYWVLKPWLQVFGINIIASRAQSALFMISGVAIWYHFIKSRFSRDLGLLSLALMVSNPMIIHYAIEGRMYALSILLVAISCVLVTGRWRWRWYAYWPCAVAMLYTHYFLVFPIAAQFMFLLLRRDQQGLSLSWIVVYGASIIVGFAPWLPIAYAQTKMTVNDWFWIGPISPNTVFSYVLSTFVHRYNQDLTAFRVFPALLYLAAWATAMINAARAKGGPYALLWLLVAIPWVCLFLLSSGIMPVFDPRYVLFSLPALITLLAAGVLASPSRWRWLVVAVLVAGHLLGIQMLRYRGFTDRRGYYAMKKIAKEVSLPVDGELPWVATDWVFTFSDARAVLDPEQHVVWLRDHVPQLARVDLLLYDRPDWYVRSLSDIPAHHVWTLENPDARMAVPANWKLIVSHRRGYAMTRLYEITR